MGPIGTKRSSDSVRVHVAARPDGRHHSGDHRDVVDLVALEGQGDDYGLFVRHDAELIAEATRVATGPASLEALLERFTRLVLTATGAYRATVFRFDTEAQALTLWATASRDPKEHMWEAGLALGPISLADVPPRLAALEGGTVLTIPDARASDLVPPDWTDIFDVGAALVAPLHAAGEIVGVLVADWREPREFPDDLVVVMGAIAGSLALAASNVLLHERVAAKTRALERLVGVAGALNSSSSLHRVLQLVCSAFEDLVGTTHCSIWVLDPTESHGIRMLTWSGEPWFAGHQEYVDRITPEQVRAVIAHCEGAGEPLVYPDLRALEFIDPVLVPDTVSAACLFPLRGDEGLVGLVVAGFPEAVPVGPEVLGDGGALAGLAMAAVERAHLHERLRRRLQRLEVLYRLSDVVVGTADLGQALAELNGALEPELDIRLEGISVADAGLRGLLGARRPDGREVDAIRRWRAALARERPLRLLRQQPGRVLVPVVHHAQVQGALRVSAGRDLGPQDEDLLVAIGAGCAEVVHKAGLSRSLAESERRFVINSERDRIARDLHDSTAQLLTGMGMMLAEYRLQAPDGLWRDRFDQLTKLAARGSDELRQAIHSLLFQEVRQRGLAGSLEDLVGKFQATTGIEVDMEVEASASDLTPAHEDALFRVAHEALRNVERHSGASRVAVRLVQDHHGAALSVQDNGVGLRDEPVEGDGHFGLRELERRVVELGGALRVEDVRPHGVVVEARVRAPAGAGRS